MASSPACWRTWSTKQYVVAALLGQLVVFAVVAGISISLAPAHISFSIVNARMTNDTNSPERYYSFTLVANNTSGHTMVRYRHLAVEIWYSQTAWVPAEASGKPTWQRPGPGNEIPFPVVAKYGQYSEATNETRPEAATNSSTVGGLSSRVAVEAKVSFKFGMATTRIYTVRASCSPVNFSGTPYQLCH